jgi:NADPH2:quinone reductase
VKALLCKEYGSLDALRVEDVPAPVPAAGELLINVAAASVNFPDALMVQGKYQVKPPLPFIPGAEISGTVVAVGDGVDSSRIGKRVVAIPGRGAFAEQVAVRAETVIVLDDRTDLASAAAVPLTYGTAYHALLDRAQLKAGETLLVLGAGGGVGIAAIELGKIMGAIVIAAASSQEKLDAARGRGATHLINYNTEDLRARLKEITGDKGVDVVCDPVGGALAEPALRATGWRGRYLVIGFAAGEIPRIPLNLTLLKGSSIVGVFWGEFMRREPRAAGGELAQLLGWLSEGRLRPLISARYPLENGGAALTAIYERKVIGKLLITMGL